jgi:26S proteasome regulatory subunit T5
MDVFEGIFDEGIDTSEFDDLSADEILRRARLLDNTIRLLKDESTRLSLEQSGLKEKVQA